MEYLNWIGIGFCLTQSAMFSGLNLAFFSVTRLRLEIEAANGNQAAQKVLRLRKDSNFLLTTILWGNVGINVLVTLLSNSVMTGMIAFLFSTVLITFFGEIIPQAYFSRHALRMASLMAPVLRVYQILLYVVAKPSAMLLDRWLGDESIQFFREKTLKQLIRKHVEESPDIDTLEGIGAINFLSLDDLLIEEEGETIHPDSIISLPFAKGPPIFPSIQKSIDDPFLHSIHKSGHKWIIVLNEKQEPASIIDADSFLRDALLDDNDFDPMSHTHIPIVVSNEKVPLGEVLQKFETETTVYEDDEIKRDVVLLWGKKRQIITGSDILGRLLRDIV